MAATDTCICCGAPVPEGRMICWQCEHPKPCPCDNCPRDADCTGRSKNADVGCATFDRWARFTFRWIKRLFAPPKPKREVWVYYHPDEMKGGNTNGLET